jgi:hypothetical protein
MHHPTLCASSRAARWLAACLLALGALLSISAPPAARAASVVYVRADASGTGDGSSWANAYTSLVSALSTAGSGDQIWVAAGTYTPTSGTDRTASFTLKSGVAVYGGFAGTETQLSQRDWSTNVTTLSGDIGVVGDTGDNSYHVVTGADGATLDGFTVSGGNANGDGNSLYDTGAGIFNAPASPALSNLVIRGNTASYTGGGVYNNFSSAPTLTNVTISGNSAQYGGGVYNNNSSSPALTNALIAGNWASAQGGGIYANAGSSPTLKNVTVASNFAGDGAGIWNLDGNLTIQNSIIWGNRASSPFGSTISSIYSAGSSTTAVTYSLVEQGYDGQGNLDSDPKFESATDALSSPTNAGDYHLQLGSPAIDAGDNSGVDTTTDIAGNPRQIDIPGAPDTGNGAAPIVDLGAYEVPTVAISSIVRLNPSASQTNAPSVQFGVTFSANVSDVDASDFVVNVVDGSLAGASVNSVTGSGKTYVVTVGTGSGAGTLRLEPASTAQVHTESGNSAGVSGFSGGETYQIGVGAPVFIGIIAGGGPQTNASTRDQTIGLYGVAEPGATVWITRLDTNQSWSLNADVDGEWSSAVLGPALPEGDYTFSAFQIDTYGHHSPDTSPFTVTIDLTAPAAPAITGITTDGGRQASGSTGDPTIGLNGTAEAGSTIALTRAGFGVIGPTTANAGGAWSFDYTGTALAVGSYSFTATATDAAGNTSLPSGSFAVTVRGGGSVIYVRPGGAGATDGTSWATAFASPASALAVAQSGDQIWVAAGTYTPINSGDRAASFRLKSGVAMYGGFAGTETLLSQRAWATNVTKLTGDLSGDGESSPHNSDNSYHVVVGADGATLDGFTISGGNADGDDDQGVGGGIYNPAASPTLAHLTIGGNYAGNGGGMYNDHGSPALTAVTFSGNSANNSGGGMYNKASSPTITNSVFSNNTTVASGGGLLNNNGSHPSLSNVTFSGNTANSGGGMYNWNSSPSLTDVTLSSNAARNGLGGGMVNDGGSNTTLANVSFTGNSASSYGGAIHNAASTLRLTGGTISGNTAAGNGGAIHNVAGSTLHMSGVTISGNKSTNAAGGGLYNIASTAALTNTTISQNTAKGSGGGILNYSQSALSLASSTISGNSGYYGGGIESYGALTISESTFSANTAIGGGGGGIDVGGGLISVSNSLVRDNVATDNARYGTGGGMQLYGGLGTITNTTFSGNQANGPQDDGGGAVMIYTGTLTLNNVTIAGNSTTSDGSTGNGGGGISVVSGATVTLKNTIVAGNTSSAGKPDLSGPVVSGGHNLAGDSTGSSGLTHGSSGDMVGASAATLDAKLAVLASNGGPTQTRALLSGSPVIDAGNAATCAAADQRGYARGAACDIGAYEHQSYSVGLPLIRSAP